MNDDLRGFIRHIQALQADMDKLGVGKPQLAASANPPGAVGASMPLWSDERLMAAYHEHSDRDCTDPKLLFRIRDDYETQRAASGGVPREVAQTMREALEFERKICQDQNPNTFVSDWRQAQIDRFDAALAWLQQHAPGEG